MNTPTFEGLLDRHGADLARWPADLRADAAALVATSADARDLHAAMRTVEDVLRASSRTPGAAGGMPDELFPLDFAATAMRRPQARRVSALARTTGWGAAVAAALVLGVVVGNMRFDASDSNPDQLVTSALETTWSVDVD